MKLFKLRQLLWMVCFGGALGLSGCGPAASSLSLLPAGQAFGQGSLTNNKIDVLWVIDNSGSMLTKQQNLANSFDSFTQVFLDTNFDFHMAIVTSDTRSIVAGGQAGIFQGAPSVITNTTPNFSNTFKANVVVGALGDANAKELDAISLSLSSALLSGSNTGFLRSDAFLAVIILSDADDTSSTATVSDTISFLNTLKPPTTNGTITKQNYSVSSVAVDTSNASNTICPLPYEDGTKFKSLSSLTGGNFTSICEANFAAGMLDLSTGIVQLITQIPLQRTPVVGTIGVAFNGVAVPESSSNGWTYTSTGNKILFHGTYIPTDSTYINVNFIPTDVIR